MSEEGQALAGILLLSLVTVEAGGLDLVRVVRGRAGTTEFQEKFARAEHPHSRVLLVLVCQLYAGLTFQTGLQNWLSRSGAAVAGILMPAGFFLSSMGAARTKPNALIGLVFAGAVVLAAGPSSLGLGLLKAPGSGNP